jgi:hypothetical protein
MPEPIPFEKWTPLPNASLAILPGGHGVGATTTLFVTKLLRRYQQGGLLETVGFKTHSLAQAHAYVLGLPGNLREACLLARIYECDNPRTVPGANPVATQGTSARTFPGMRPIEDIQLQA